MFDGLSTHRLTARSFVIVLTLVFVAGTCLAVVGSAGAATKDQASGTPSARQQKLMTQGRAHAGTARSAQAASVVIGPAATISNGTVSLGVNPLGDLNNEDAGLRYEPTGADALLAGCPCEGWGVADASTSVSGFADESTGISGSRLDQF